MINKFSAVLAILALFLANTLWAGSVTKQVLIESKMVTVSKVTEQVLFETAKGRDVTSEISALLSTLPDGTKTLDASIVSYGGGADFRRIQTRNPLLVLHPEVGDTGRITLRPEMVTDIQVQKSSVAAPAAPFLFGALGLQYEGAAHEAASNPGQACPVTGKSTGSGERSSGVSGAIDRAGMAAGMALLSSQAKGELDGIKIKWKLDPKLQYKFDLKYETFNTTTKKTENITTTLNFTPQAPAPAAEASKAVIRSYTFRDIDELKDFRLQTDVNVQVEAGQTKIDIISDLAGKGGFSDWEPSVVKVAVGEDKEYKHIWDDFDDHGKCHNCDFYEPYADERNYDDEGYYMGPPPLRLSQILETMLEISDSHATLKSVLVSNVPVIRALFSTEIKNKKTKELLIITRPVILDDPM